MTFKIQGVTGGRISSALGKLTAPPDVFVDTGKDKFELRKPIEYKLDSVTIDKEPNKDYFRVTLDGSWQGKYGRPIYISTDASCAQLVAKAISDKYNVSLCVLGDNKFIDYSKIEGSYAIGKK